MTADGAGSGAEQRLNPVLPAQLLVQTADELRVSLNDAVGDVVLLTVDLVFVSDAERVRPLIGAVVNVCSALAGERENRAPMAVDPHRGHLLLKRFKLFPVELLPHPCEDGIPGR